MDGNVRKEALFSLHEGLTTLLDAIDLIYEGLWAHRTTQLDEAGELIVGVHRKCEALLREMRDHECDEAQRGAYLEMAEHVLRITENTERLSGTVRKKIATNMLFSDMAMAEIDTLFMRTRDIVLNAGQVLLTQRVLLFKHLTDSSSRVQSLADDAATKHQERLIEGLCTPAFSAVYVKMLDAFKAIAWHIKEITRGLSG